MVDEDDAGGRPRPESLLSHLPMGAFLLDPTGSCSDFNRAAERMLGVPAAESLGRDFLTMGWWRDSGLSERHLHTARTGQAFDGRVVVGPRPDRELDLEWHMRRIEPAQGDGVLVTFQEADDEGGPEGRLALTRLSIDRAADLIHWLAPDGRLLYVSDSNCERHGYTREELLRLTVFDLDPGMTLSGWAEHWSRLRAEGTVRLETTHRAKSGEVFPLEVIANYVEHEGRQYNFAYARDISARLHLEESLRRSQFSIEKAADNIFWIDEEGAFIYVNESTCVRLGYTREELLNMTVFDVDPQAPRPWPEHWQRVKARGWATFETVHRTKAGETFPVEVTVDHSRFDGREYHHVFSRDISARRRAEEALRRSEHLLREAQAVAHLGAYVLDVPSGTWTSSQMLDVVFGIDEGYERTVEGWLELVHPEERDRMRRYLFQDVFQERRDFDKEYRVLRRSDGSERWVHGRGRLEFDETGAPRTMLGTIQDITERRQADEVLRETEERLRQSQRMESVGRLAGGIAHDFNNLLTAIIGQTELLRNERSRRPEDEEGLSEIRAAADRAASLTQQLLAFSRRQPLQPRILDVSVVTHSMVGLFRRILGEDIELVLLGDNGEWRVEADPGQLEQVILNLVVNARDAMPGGGTLRIETTNVEVADDPDTETLGVPPGPHVRLAVSDTGRGMDQDTLARVFEPFFTTKEPGEGTGLGLSTAYGIVTQSGGHIRARSSPGSGATFEIYLPRVNKPADWPPAVSARSSASSQRGSGTLLVVEDEPAVLRLASRILSTGGYRVLTAGSPADALVVFREHADVIDLVLTDVVLPGMSGRAMVDGLREEHGWRFRVVYMSGYPRDAIVHGGRLDEGISFLEKPFTPEGLLAKIRGSLDHPVDAVDPGAEAPPPS